MENETSPGNQSPKTGSNPLAPFEERLRTHGPRIYALAVRLCGNPVDGEDLAQDTFARAFRREGQFRGEADWGTWVYRICVNLWKNRVRFEKRRYFWSHVPLERPNSDGDPSPLELADPRDRTEGPAEIADQRRALENALNALSPAERAVLVLREMEDKSYEEIAALLQVPLGTVKSRVARAREALKEKIGGTLETPP